LERNQASTGGGVEDRVGVDAVGAVKVGDVARLAKAADTEGVGFWFFDWRSLGGGSSVIATGLAVIRHTVKKSRASALLKIGNEWVKIQRPD
jgi:hypothetical protein